MTDTAPNPAKRSAARSPWPYAIVGVFLIQGIVLAATMLLASRSPANAEPDYYEKAMAWDEHNAAINLPIREKWWWEVSAAASDGRGQRTVRFDLADGDDAPISSSSVTTIYFHRAAPLNRFEATLTESEPGVFEALLPMPAPGLWEFRFVLNTPSGPASITETIEAP